MSALLAVNDVTVEFQMGRGSAKHILTAVKSASIAVNTGEIVGLVGESGSGKSTLSRVICGLQPEYKGEVLLAGEVLTPHRSRKQWRQVQMVFQDPFSSLDPRMTIGRMLNELLRYHRIVPPRGATKRAEEMLDLVQLPKQFLDRTPATMSGGQRQRVAIARALILQPEVLVADEAVSALDVSIQAGIINLLADLRRDLGLAVLFAAHDLAVVRSLCDRVTVIHYGTIVEENGTDDLFAHPFDDYTQRLLRSVPRFSSAFLDGRANQEGLRPSIT
jgi:peptide/nickel transport system ATP-binding protein